MRTNTHRRASLGITLIELMIVVAIVAILGSIAIASYRGYVLRSNRAEAAETLLRIQVAQEKYYLNRNEYATDLSAASPGGLGIPAATERGLYTIELLEVDDPENEYTAQATAIGGQAADKAECRILSIDHTGQRLPDPGATDCWR